MSHMGNYCMLEGFDFALCHTQQNTHYVVVHGANLIVSSFRFTKETQNFRFARKAQVGMNLTDNPG